MATISSNNLVREQPIQYVQIAPINFPKKESSISHAIANEMGRFVPIMGAVGFSLGGIISAANGDKHPILSALAVAAIFIGVSALTTKTMQTVADASVDAAVFVAKLPFKAVYYTATGLHSGVKFVAQKVYQCSVSNITPQAQQ